MKQNRVISGAVAALVLAALLAGCGSTATGASSADSTPLPPRLPAVKPPPPPQNPRPKLLCRTRVYRRIETDSSMVHANEACDGKAP
mgnify:CR=1 FL=1